MTKQGVEKTAKTTKQQVTRTDSLSVPYILSGPYSLRKVALTSSGGISLNPSISSRINHNITSLIPIAHTIDPATSKDPTYDYIRL